METKVIRLPAQFNYSYHKEFTECCSEIISCEAARVELDFSRVEYLDSSALGMLVLLHKKANDKNLKISITGAKGTAKDVLMMANMHKLFEFV